MFDWLSPAALKAVAAGVVLFIALGALYSWRNSAVTKAVDAVAVETAVAANKDWESAASELAEKLTACELREIDADRRAADAQARADAAVSEANARKAQAERTLADFQSRWAARSQNCGAALLDMEAACVAEIGDY